MTISLQTFYIFFRSTWAAILSGKNSRLTDYVMAGKMAIHQPSYRASKPNQRDRLIVARMIGFAMKSLWQKRISMRPNASSAIFAGKSHDEISCRKFVEITTGDSPELFVRRNELLGSSNIGHKILATLILVAHFIPGTFVGIFSGKRVGFAFLAIEWVELTNLMWMMKRSGVKKIYQWNIFEKDSNLLYILCRANGIELCKVTNDSPLYHFNEQILSDELIYTLHYQAEELKGFGNNVRVKKMIPSLPFNMVNHLPKYNLDQIDDALPANVIGFYSSGHWIRREQGDTFLEDGFYEAEEMLIEFLNEYLGSRKDVNLVVFPHPLEKKSEAVYLQTIQFYSKAFSQIRWKLMPRDSVSSRSFDQCNTGIAVYSSIGFERLFLGFKNLFFSEGMSFPMEGTNMVKISPKSKEELFILLDKSLAQSQSAFFSDHGIESYSVRLNVALKNPLSLQFRINQGNQA